EERTYGEPHRNEDGSTVFHPFCFMTNVERGLASPSYFVDYQLGDARDTHIRISSVTEQDTELTLTDARPPTDPNAYSLRYVFERRAGESPLTSHFSHIFEPYSGKPFIDRVEPVPVASPSTTQANQPIAMRVIMGNRMDTFIFNPSPDSLVKTPD